MPAGEHSPDAGRAEKPSFASLFESEESPLLRYAFSLTGGRAIAEDLVQEVFLKLHEHWDTVANPKAWLYRSVRNRAYNHHRDHRREILTDEPGAQSAEEKSSPGDMMQRMEAAGFLRLLLAELDDEDRRLIELKYYEDLKYSEISARTGLSVGNVGYRLHHLLKLLAARLRHIGIDGAIPQPPNH